MELAAIAAVLGAMGGILKIVLDYMKAQRESFDNHLLAQQKEFETFMGNHMSKMSASISHNSQAIEANTKVLRAIARRAEVNMTRQEEHWDSQEGQ